VGLTANSVYLWTLPMFHCNGMDLHLGRHRGGRHPCVQRAIGAGRRSSRRSIRLGVTHLCGAPPCSTCCFRAGDEARRLKQKVTITTGGARATSTVIGAMETHALS